MTKRQKQVVTMLGAWALVFGIVPAANAMHIMEGYLPCLLYTSGQLSGENDIDQRCQRREAQLNNRQCDGVVIF